MAMMRGQTRKIYTGLLRAVREVDPSVGRREGRVQAKNIMRVSTGIAVAVPTLAAAGFGRAYYKRKKHQASVHEVH